METNVYSKKGLNMRVRAGERLSSSAPRVCWLNSTEQPTAASFASRRSAGSFRGNRASAQPTFATWKWSRRAVVEGCCRALVRDPRYGRNYLTIFKIDRQRSYYYLCNVPIVSNSFVFHHIFKLYVVFVFLNLSTSC